MRGVGICRLHKEGHRYVKGDVIEWTGPYKGASVNEGQRTRRKAQSEKTQEMAAEMRELQRENRELTETVQLLRHTEEVLGLRLASREIEVRLMNRTLDLYGSYHTSLNAAAPGEARYPIVDHPLRKSNFYSYWRR